MTLCFIVACSSDTVGPDFHLEVEVYCAVPCEDDNITHKPATPVKSVFKRIWKVSVYKSPATVLSMKNWTTNSGQTVYVR